MNTAPNGDVSTDSRNSLLFLFMLVNILKMSRIGFELKTNGDVSRIPD